MRIDDRSVNGQVNLEPTDIMEGFTIVIHGDTPGWFYWDMDREMYEPIDPSIVAARIVSLLRERPMNILRFGIRRATESSGTTMLCPSAYTIKGGNVVIDIEALIPNKKLTISLTTGDITMGS